MDVELTGFLVEIGMSRLGEQARFQQVCLEIATVT